MKNDFKNVMSQRTDDELIIILSKDIRKYQASAIESAQKEVEKRKIDPKIINQLKNKDKIETSLKQEIKSRSTSLKNRVINQIIDLVVILIMIQSLNTLISLIFKTTEDFSLLTLIISYFGYYIYMENKYQQTLGKLYTKTKVVTLSGAKPRLIKIIKRTFLRTIPYDVISFIIDKNGFHDINSKTNVIDI